MLISFNNSDILTRLLSTFHLWNYFVEMEMEKGKWRWGKKILKSRDFFLSRLLLFHINPIKGENKKKSKEIMKVMKFTSDHRLRHHRGLLHSQIFIFRAAFYLLLFPSLLIHFQQLPCSSWEGIKKI